VLPPDSRTRHSAKAAALRVLGLMRGQAVEAGPRPS
jgi:hypothetical protein